MGNDLKKIADDMAKLSTRCAVGCAIELGVPLTQSDIIEKMVSAAVAVALEMKTKDLLKNELINAEDINTIREKTIRTINSIIMVGEGGKA